MIGRSYDTVMVWRARRAIIPRLTVATGTGTNSYQSIPNSSAFCT